MHIYFPVSRIRPGLTAEQSSGSADDAGLMFVVRDPDDESEWQYLGNPEVATKISLHAVVARFIRDCSDPDGSVAPNQVVAALRVRDALAAAARQIDEALEFCAGK